PRPPRSPPPRPRPPRGPRGPRPSGWACSSAGAGAAWASAGAASAWTGAAAGASVGSVAVSFVWFSSCILELQSAFAGSVGEGLHPAMEEEAAAVEHDLADAGLLRPVRERLADCSGAILGRARLALDFLVERRGGGQRLARAVVDHLRVDVPARAVDRQPRLASGTRPERGAHPTAASFEEGKFGHGYFFLPSLRKIYSPRYLMPLPLYGSGLRQRRISAATWPTFCLSMPLISTVFWSGVFTSMPSGSL